MSLDNPFVPSHDPRIGCSFDYVKEKKKKKKNKINFLSNLNSSKNKS